MFQYIHEKFTMKQSWHRSAKTRKCQTTMQLTSPTKHNSKMVNVGNTIYRGTHENEYRVAGTESIYILWRLTMSGNNHLQILCHYNINLQVICSRV